MKLPPLNSFANHIYQFKCVKTMTDVALLLFIYYLKGVNCVKTKD